MSYTARWSLLRTAFGLTTAVIVFALTGSVGWAIVWLLGSGVVVNAVLRPGTRHRPARSVAARIRRDAT
jgi:hypothetical protein